VSADRVDLRVYTPDGRELAVFRDIRIRRLPGRPAAGTARPLPSAGLPAVVPALLPAVVPAMLPTASRAVTSWFGKHVLSPVVSGALHTLGRAASAGLTEAPAQDQAARPAIGPAVTSRPGMRPDAATGAVIRPQVPTVPEVPTAPEVSTDPREALLSCAAAVLGLRAGDLDARLPLRDLGLDSLMAVQLSRKLLTDHGIDLAAKRLLGAEPVGRILAEPAAAAR